ncbi:hypothetical protein M5E87_04755 [Flavonifractor plautii]|nr:hypothetical protein M5E87_04755 [Flavonifractor plautii]
MSGEERPCCIPTAPPGAPAPRTAARGAAGPGALLGLMRDVGQLFDCEPVVLQRPDSPALLLFYPDTVFPWRDLAEVCGGALAGLWPVTVYGTTARRETGELRAAVRADGATVIRLRSVSGPFDQLTGLCLRVEMDTPARAAAWAALCAGSARTRSSAALEPAQAAALGMAFRSAAPRGAATPTWPGRRTPVCWTRWRPSRPGRRRRCGAASSRTGPSLWNSSGCGMPTGRGRWTPCWSGSSPSSSPWRPWASRWSTGRAGLPSPGRTVRRAALI